MTQGTATGSTAHAACPSWMQVRDAIATCWPHKVIELLAPHAPADLKALHAPLKTLHSEFRVLERADHHEVRHQYAPLLAAALMIVQTPAQAAWWLSKPALLHTTWAWGPDGGSSNAKHGLLLTILTTRRAADWTGDLACRLTAALRPDPDRALWRIASGLAEHSGAAVPLTDGHVVGWVNTGSQVRYRRPEDAGPESLVGWLRAEPRLGEYVARIFEIPGLGSALADSRANRASEDDEWPTALAKLCAEGRLVRAELIDACTARLLSGDRPGSVHGHIMVHEQLAPTPPETHDRLPTYLGMAASSSGAVAKIAQQTLRRLDAATPLDVHTLAGLSADVLARAETGLANQQIGWIDAALRKNPAAAPVLLPVIGTAFTHPTVPVQQRALRTAAKHLRLADADVLASLREAAQHIDPALYDEACRAFPTQGAAAVPTSKAPPTALPPYLPTPMPPALETLDGLVTAFAPALADSTPTPLEVERLMAAVATHADRDRAALAEALAPLRTTYPPETMYLWQQENFPSALRCLFDAVFGEDHRQSKFARLNAAEAAQPTTAIILRINELTDTLLTGHSVPALLATPTEASGAIDYAVLRTRFAMYEARAVSPLKHDVQQALIRVTDSARDLIRTELSAVPALPASIPTLDDYPDVARTYGRNLMPYLRPLGMPSATRPEPLCPVGAEATSPYWVLVPPYDREDRIAVPRHGWSLHPEYWPILLPHHPELLAAHAVPLLYRQAVGEDRSGPTVFPHLAETAGIPGPITHLALAYGLAAERLQRRIAAQDALLTLAARDLLQPTLLGKAAAELWRRTMIKPNRLIASLQEVEQAGATPHVFATAGAAIESLATTPDVRGLPDLLLLATRCAAGNSPLAADFPALPQLAAVKKPARVGQEARRLLDALRRR